MPEVNFDGIVGPTHNYAGLSRGNVASAANRGATSRPREAALQGLGKAAAIARLGAKAVQQRRQAIHIHALELEQVPGHAHPPL